MKSKKQIQKEIQECEKKVSEVCGSSDKKRQLEIYLAYGEDEKSLKKQLKKKGLKFDKNLIYGAELTRKIILSFLNNNLISKKQASKAFDELHDQITPSIANLNGADGSVFVK